MKILFAGTPENAAIVLHGLVEQGVEVAAVLTRNDAEVGRKRILTPSAVAQAAEKLGIPVIKANQINESVRQQITKVEAEAAIVVAYGVLLKKSDLDLLPKGWHNVHFSLLPRLRGAAPVQWALLTGEHTTGVTLFQIDEGLDTGPIWLQVPTTIERNETAGELLSRLSLLSVSVVSEVLPKIASGIQKPVSQNGNPGPGARKLTRQDAKVDWFSSAREIENKVRALNPEPIAYSSIASNQVQIFEARQSTDESELSPGYISIRNGRVLVGTGAGNLELVSVRPAGKKTMAAQDWHRGLREEKFDV